MSAQSNDESVVEECSGPRHQDQGGVYARLSSDGSDSSSARKSDDTHVQENRPRFIKQGFDFLTIATDLATVVAPLFLLAFGIAVLRLDGSIAFEQILGRWDNAITVLATLFPILFASTVGRLVYELARWKLERGSTMGTLEQLLGSRTVGATIVTQFRLRVFNPLGVCLLLIWSFSPLGAQSLLRMLESEHHPKTESSSIVYFDTNSPSRANGGIGHLGDSDEMTPFKSSLLASWYNALILTPEGTKTEAMDLWGNVKIPFLSSGRRSEPDKEGWTNVTLDPSLDLYSALAGITITNVPAGNTTLSIESSHLDLNCSVNQEEGRNRSGLGLEGHSWNPKDDFRKNGSWHGYSMERGANDSRPITWSMAINRFVGEYWEDLSDSPALFEKEEGVQVKPTQLLFQAGFRWRPTKSPMIGVNALCQARQEYVESLVNCSRATERARHDCSVVAQRPSQRTHAPSAVLHLSFPNVFGWISEYMPLLGGMSRGDPLPDLSLRYLLNPKLDNLFIQDGGESSDSVTDRDFSERLSQLVNTYVLLSQQFLKNETGSIKNNDYFQHNISTEVEVSSSLVRKYDVSLGWAVLFFASCLVLLLSGVSSVVFTHMADGPEILGYASTVVRDSKFIDMQATDGVADTGAMDATGIALAMKNERVRYGFMDQTPEGKALLGVGREGETRPVRDYIN